MLPLDGVWILQLWIQDPERARQRYAQHATHDKRVNSGGSAREPFSAAVRRRDLCLLEDPDPSKQSSGMGCQPNYSLEWLPFLQ